ncbi:MAG TPA: hypothetical protein VGU73_12615 [Acidimicrobiia bacterium]|nr:hypothetical protein [Acidimicrobiia bacterium]
MVIADDDPDGWRAPVTPELVPTAPEPARSTTGLHAVVEGILDSVVARAVSDPMPLHNAHDVRAHVQTPIAPGMTTLVVPALTRLSRRWAGRAVNIGSRLSFSVKTLLTTVPPLATSVALGTRELHSLASLVVQRLRAEGLPVDHRFVQRVTVNAYVWPGGGRPLAGAHAPALARVAGLWATRPLAGERTGEWAGRAAEAIEAADLRALLASYRGGPPALDA